MARTALRKELRRLPALQLNLNPTLFRRALFSTTSPPIRKGWLNIKKTGQIRDPLKFQRQNIVYENMREREPVVKIFFTAFFWVLVTLLILLQWFDIFKDRRTFGRESCVKGKEGQRACN